MKNKILSYCCMIGTRKGGCFFAFFFLGNFVLFSQNKFEENKKIDSLLKLSNQYLNELKTDVSLQYANKALSLSLASQDFSAIAKSYNLIGLNLNEFEDYKNALVYFKKGIQYAKLAKNDTLLGWFYNNIGNLYSYQYSEKERAIEYYKKSIAISRRVNVKELVYNELNLIDALFEYERIDEGNAVLKEVEDNIEQLSDEEPEAFYLYYLLKGDSYYYNQKYLDAEKFYLKALTQYEKYPDKIYGYHLISVNESMSMCYEQLHKYKKAFKHLTKADSLKESYYNQQKIKKVQLFSNQIENEEIERELTKVETEKKIQEQKILNIKIFILLITLVFIATLITLYSQFKINRIRNKTNNELKRANEELFQAKEKAIEASKIKSQFVSTVSHELRTPLYGVIGITDILENEHEELKGSSHLNALKFSANYLLSLVNDILNVYKIEEKNVVLNNQPFNLTDKIDVIVDSMRGMSEKYNNKIVVKIDENVPNYINGDYIRFSQIVINLLSNSLKFTENGEISINVSLSHQKRDLFFIQFQIIDNGIGIPEKYKNKVFEKFVQINRREDDYQGTGLGLSIVKKLVDLFNGTISLESEVNKGTKITFILPFEVVSDKQLQLSNKEYENEFNELKGIVILVVEDNRINQVVTKKMIENLQMFCIVAENGYQAIELLDTKKIDAILMDINMPLINGFETSKIIRKKGFKMPIIAVTAFDKEEIQKKAIKSGINAILSKPFETTRLLEVLKEYIKK